MINLNHEADPKGSVSSELIFLYDSVHAVDVFPQRYWAWYQAPKNLC